jgi:hypothetical protein
MKIQLVSPELKKQCKTGDVQALRESLDILYNNALCRLTQGKKVDFEKNQGYLNSLVEVQSLLSKP